MEYTITRTMKTIKEDKKTGFDVIVDEDDCYSEPDTWLIDKYTGKYTGTLNDKKISGIRFKNRHYYTVD